MNPFKFSTWQEEVPLPAKGELQMFVWQNSQVPGSRGESHECRVHACSDSLRPHGLKPTRLLCPWDYPGKNTGVDCHALLQQEVTAIVQNSFFFFFWLRWVLVCHDAWAFSSGAWALESSLRFSSCRAQILVTPQHKGS